MISILLFLPDLNGGGAQRTLINIVNHMDRSRFRPVLVLGCATGPYKGTIRKEVRTIDLKRRRVRSAVVPLARQIRVWKPDVVFSPYPDANVALIVAARVARWRGGIVLRESNHRTAQAVEWGLWKSQLVRWAYRRASRVVALSNGVGEDVRRRYGLSSEKVQTIYNPVDFDAIERMAGERVPSAEGFGLKSGGRIQITAAGRLVRQKGFDILIRALSRLREEPVHLTILGEGVERQSLASLARTLGVENLISMPGFQANPYAWFRDSDIFVLSSRWEGFGHVIVEAMACGNAVIAARCPSGPDEIISDGENGLLFRSESEEDLEEKIRHLVHHPETRRRLAEAGLARARDFDARNIVKQYDDLFERVSHSRPDSTSWK